MPIWAISGARRSTAPGSISSFPALLLNYFGQGAHLLADPAAVDNPFYRLFPTWALIPMVILASAATIIASQAVISGAFSMTSQAVQMGYLPRMQIRHTSASERGQIYVPKVNFLLLVAVLALVLGFKSSGNLGAAYGIAVTGTMTLTTSLALLYMVRVRRWNPFLAGGLFGLFLLVDLSFFGANMLKVAEGGWAPLLIGVTAFLIMSTWTTGRQAIMARRSEESLPLDMFLSGLKPDRPVRVSGTALFLTSDVDKVPASLLHNLKHNKVLHERVVLLSIKTLDIPRVPDDQRLEIRDVGHNFHTVVTRYGFVEEPDIWRVLAQCQAQDLALQPDGDLGLRRPREAGDLRSHPADEMAQGAVPPPLPPFPQRRRILPRPLQPRRGAGRADGVLTRWHSDVIRST